MFSFKTVIDNQCCIVCKKILKGIDIWLAYDNLHCSYNCQLKTIHKNSSKNVKTNEKIFSKKN